MLVRLRIWHVLAFVALLVVAALAIEWRIEALESSLRTEITAELRQSIDVTSTISAVTDERVDARLMTYSQAMNEGMGIDTTSPAATFWWAGNRLAELQARQDRVFTSMEDVFEADSELGHRFLRVHKAIDNKPFSFPYEPDDLGEPYLTYSE